LRTEYADCLMIHMCTLAQVKHEPYHEAIRELKAEGKVRFSGLSNHGPDLSLYGRLDDPMERVIGTAAEDGRFDVALFVYNYLNTERGEKALAACTSKGMGTTLMKMDPAFYIDEDKKILAQITERYKTQGKPLPEAVANLARMAEDRAERTRAFLKAHNLAGPQQARGAAITFSLNHPDVHCVCPTINNFEDLEAFLALSGRKLTKGDARVLSGYSEIAGDLYCRHACGTCEPACPQGVPVNTIMRYDYYFRAKRQEKAALVQYAGLGSRDAAPCATCEGACQQACPYGVAIQGRLILAHHRLTMP
jgi:predicted aldo/keto reductase-like oxidoreductase